MRLAHSLTIPDELERARAAGELVVFAGAGVSMGSPSNLPGFIALARQIGEPKLPWKAGYAKEIDKYLGRVARAGVKVQERARDVLDDTGGHTPLHEHLIGIFGAPDRVRLITTNFDPHFASAAERVFPGARIPEYIGPALPPGRGFRGMTQLHGSLRRAESHLVLTDGDFAEAYMAEGWAARFLARVFEDRTVLFVGYGLGDPIMRYLLHAIPPTGRWYALWHRSEVKQGAEHAIEAVTFGSPRARDRFRDLNEGMRRWHDFARRSPADHERELRRLIKRGPPKSPVDADYLRARLCTDQGRAVFWGVARSDRWFHWAAAEGFLDSLTDARRAEPRAGEWGRWCLDHFMTGDVPRLLRHLTGRGFALAPAFRAEIVRFLWLRKPLPPRPVIRQLIALIAGGPTADFHETVGWEWLLERLVRENYHEEALALLAVATQPGLQALERFYTTFEDSDLTYLSPLATRVGLRVSAPRLAHMLSKQGSALAEALPHKLLALGTQRIEDAYRLLDLARGEGDVTDWFSFGRTSIAPSGQDRRAHGEDVLVEIVRLALGRLAAMFPAELGQFVEQYGADSRTLLRRLAVHALSVCDACSPDEALARATRLSWARDIWVRPELYRLLGKHFGRATEDARRGFVDALREDASWGGALNEREMHARFSLSVKLEREAPDSTAARTFAAEERAAHPTWREQDRDGFLSRVEVYRGGDEPSPIEAGLLVSWDPSRALEELRAAGLTYDGEGGPTDRAYALLGAVQQAARENAAWGAAVLSHTVNGDAAAIQVAEATLNGLRVASVNSEVQALVLEGAARGAWAPRLAHALATLVAHWADGINSGTPAALLDALDAAADTIYHRSTTMSPAIEDRGWTERALNHPAGCAAQVWWHVANARDWVDGQFVPTLDEREKARWIQVLEDPSPGSAYARAILGMATDRLAGGDFPWAAAKVFPAFDPASGGERAAQLWDGRLMQSRWIWSTAEGLSPYVERMVRASAKLLPARAEELGELFAMLAAGVEQSGMTRTTLHAFVEYTSLESRKAFAEALPGQLESLPAASRESAWKDLLRPYWNDRRTNMPLALEAEELRPMVRWALALPEVADDVVATLRASPNIEMEHADSVLWDLANEEASWVRDHPGASAGIVAALAERRSIPGWSTDDAVEVLEMALKHGASREAVRGAAELVAALPSSRAARLAERLRGHD